MEENRSRKILLYPIMPLLITLSTLTVYGFYFSRKSSPQGREMAQHGNGQTDDNTSTTSRKRQRE